jgi:hypothetical protein
VPNIILGIVTCAAMCQTISGENAVDGTHGRQWLDPFLLQDSGDGMSSVSKAPVIEMESFHDNNLLYFGTGEGVCGNRHF